MFLKYLSDREFDEEYWPFIFRLETVLSGIVKEAAERLSSGTPEESIALLFDALGAALDRRHSPLPEGWWPEPIPSMEWFDDYLHDEFDAIRTEAKRLSEVTKAKESAANGEREDPFDRRRIHDCAHRSERFRAFIVGQEARLPFGASAPLE